MSQTDDEQKIRDIINDMCIYWSSTYYNKFIIQKFWNDIKMQVHLTKHYPN